MSAPALTAEALRQFTGSESVFRHAIARQIVFTEGAKYLADAAGAYWLLDEIALAQRFDARVSAEAFQVWQLTVKPDRRATLRCGDGNGRDVFEKPIPWTDFPLDEIALWFIDNTILLPSEY